MEIKDNKKQPFNMQSAITVIIPVFKVDKYIKKCIESIIQQTHRNFELILIDDGSPDNCSSICDYIASHYDNVFIVHKLNGGLSSARNSGIELAQLLDNSSWFAFIDSDDYIHPRYLETLYNLCIDTEADLAICDFCKVDEQGNNVDQIHSFKSEIITDNRELFERLYSDWRIHPVWNKIYSKKIFDKIRFDEGKIHEDEFIIHKIIYEAKKVVFIEDILYYYLVRKDGIIGNKNALTLLDAKESEILRYYYCKERKLPTEFKVTGREFRQELYYLRHILPSGSWVRYRQICKMYFRVFFDKPYNRNLKAFLFYIYPEKYGFK